MSARGPVSLTPPLPPLVDLVRIGEAVECVCREPQDIPGHPSGIDAILEAAS